MDAIFSKIDQIGEPEARRATNIWLTIFAVAIVLVPTGWFLYNVFTTNEDIFESSAP